MLKTELFEIIANSENSGVEFKRDDCRPEQLAKEIVAMVNHQGGLILLGVEDDGEISGIQRENLEEWVMDGVVRKIHPQILPSYQEIQVDDDKRVAILSFEQEVSKPYVCRHNNREEIYIRVGSTSRLATREQRARLFEVGRVLRAETLPVSGTSAESLDMGRIADYLKHVIRDPDLPTSDEGWVRRLLGLGFLTNKVGATPVCTMAGLLLFGYRPRRYLGQSGIRLMVFEGVDKTDQSRLDEVLDMPMVGLWKWEPGSERQLVSDGIIEGVIKMLKPFISEENDNIDEGMRRERKWHYPIEAFREILVNAITHRDWTRFMDIEITCYSDRLEVISPGAMQNSMTVEKMMAGRRSPRNGLIVDILKDYGYVDVRGMGVRTKVVPLMKSENHNKPVFESTEDHLKTILYRKKKAGQPDSIGQ